MKDDQKNDGTQAGNGITSEGWRAIKIKPKEQAEAEKLLFFFFPEASHWEAPTILLPFNPTTYFPEFKQEALAILSTGIIKEDGLRGTGHKEFFPVNQRDLKDLIIALLEKDYQYQDVTFYPGDILNKFDFYFDNMAALAKLAGITDSKINKVRRSLQTWRDQISLSVSQGAFPSNWRELLKGELITCFPYKPKSQAQAFAIIFLGYAPIASDKTIAIWVNTVLKYLQRHTASESKLREYISKERKLRPRLPQKPSKNTL
jgi:hypothetical protein